MTRIYKAPLNHDPQVSSNLELYTQVLSHRIMFVVVPNELHVEPQATEWVVQHVDCSRGAEIPIEVIHEPYKSYRERRVVVVSGIPDLDEQPEMYGLRTGDILRKNNMWNVTFLALESLESKSYQWSDSLVDATMFNETARIISQQIQNATSCQTILLATRRPEGIPPEACLPSILLASLVATGFSAVELQIIGSQDGLYTADPNKVSMAQQLPIVSSAEWAELATGEFHDQAVDIAIKQAMERNIPVRIRGPQYCASGTLIHPKPEGLAPERSVSSEVIQGRRVSDFAAPGWQQRDPKLPTAVTIKEHVQVLEISSRHTKGSASFMPDVFGVLNMLGVTVELLSTSVMHVGVAVRLGCESEVFRLVEELEKLGTAITIRQNMAILSLIGRRMPSMIGIAGHMFSTLAKNKVNIEMMSQSASEMNISCVVDGKDAIKALNLVHHACLSPNGYPGASAPNPRPIVVSVY